MQQLNVRIADEEAAALDRIASQSEGILTKQGVVRLLIRQAMANGWNPLDSAGTLGLASGSEASTSNSYIPKSKNISTSSKSKGRKQGQTTIYPDDFTTFWKAYQSLPVKASKQSKPLALQAWKETIAATDPSALLNAVHKQIEIQQAELRTERGFTVAMPDCFRWLRDGCFHALLEDNAPAVNDKPSWML